MAFRIHDLMMDVRPGGLQMANPECTCQVTVKREIQEEPETPPAGEPDSGDDPSCRDTLLPSDDCRPDRMDALAAELASLRAQLRRDLGQGA